MSRNPRTVSDIDSSERPTFRPPARARKLESEVRIKDEDRIGPLGPIRSLLERFEAKDFMGALALADEVLDASRVPELLVPRELLGAVTLDERGRALVAQVDGCEPLESVFERSGLPLLDAMQLFCELVERRVLTFR
jgi:hypothetical protein